MGPPESDLQEEPNCIVLYRLIKFRFKLQPNLGPAFLHWLQKMLKKVTFTRPEIAFRNILISCLIKTTEAEQ